MSKYAIKLHTLELIGCLLIGDKDVLPFQKGNWRNTLTSLSIAGCKDVTDIGVKTIVESLGPILSILNISESQTTDAGVDIISSNCTKLRQLDLSKCIDITNYSVRSIATGISCITTLKLDGNPHIAAKVVNSFVANKQLLFAVLGKEWLGTE